MIKTTWNMVTFPIDVCTFLLLGRSLSALNEKLPMKQLAGEKSGI
jgi:hypothetical protein